MERDIQGLGFPTITIFTFPVDPVRMNLVSAGLEAALRRAPTTVTALVAGAMCSNPYRRRLLILLRH